MATKGFRLVGAVFIATILGVFMVSGVAGENLRRVTSKNVAEIAPTTFALINELSTEEARERALATLDKLFFTDREDGTLRFTRNGFAYFDDDLSNAGKGHRRRRGLNPVLNDPVEYIRTHQRIRRFISDQSATIDPATNTPLLHSKLGASTTLFLDFDGHTLPATSEWGDAYECQPFDPSDDGMPFNVHEQDVIIATWQRVAEDFAPFDVDVTTEAFSEPQQPTVLHAVITYSRQADGTRLPSHTAAGVALLDIFGAQNIADFSPAFTYYDNNGDDDPVALAETTSHEIGHNLALSHDSTAEDEYFEGIDGTTFFNSWAPIMGFSDYASLSQWSNGQFRFSTNTEDDFEIIGARFGFREDDVGDSIDAPNVGNVTATSATEFMADGIISSRDDIDVWSVDIDNDDSGISITANPWYASMGETAGNNLDIALSLYDDSGTLLAMQSPTGFTNASVFLDGLDAGTYFIAVTGAGDPLVLDSDYGSQGQYRIEGSIVDNTVTFGTMPANFESTCPIDVNENNNDVGAATDLSFSAVITDDGDITSDSTQIAFTAEGNVCGSVDLDFFALPLCSDGDVSISVTFTHNEGDIDLILFDADGEVLDSSETSNNKERITLSATHVHANVARNTHRHTLSVYNYDDDIFGSSSNNVDYKLTATVQCSEDVLGTCVPDAYEPNQSTDEAVAVGAQDSTGIVLGMLCSDSSSDDNGNAGVGYYADAVDYYNVSLCGNSAFNVNLNSLVSTDGLGDSGLRLKVTVYTHDGSQEVGGEVLREGDAIYVDMDADEAGAAFPGDDTFAVVLVEPHPSVSDRDLLYRFQFNTSCSAPTSSAVRAASSPMTLLVTLASLFVFGAFVVDAF